jgi:hypothetical protein
MNLKNRRYFVLDTATKLLAVDEDGFPIKLETLEQAHALRTSLLPDGAGPESLALLDDLGNKWLWNVRGVMRFALSCACRDIVYEIVSKAYDFTKEWPHNTFRGTVAGDVEQEVTARLPDGPPIPVMHHGREWGTTTERYADKSHWANRGPLAPMIADAPTQTHKQELTARRMKKQAANRKEREDALAGKQMTCQGCGRLICSKLGLIAHHGYERPGDGWQTASCVGAKEDPFEVSNLVLLHAIRSHEARVEELRENIAGVEAETLSVIVTWSPSSWDRLKEKSVDYQVSRENFEAVASKLPGVFNLSTGTSTFEGCKSGYLGRLEGRLRRWRAGLVECRKRNEGWKQTHRFVAGEWKKLNASEADVAA